MNASIENAFAAWLVDAGIGMPIHTGASTEEFDPEQLVVIVSVPDVEHSVGPLHRATVNLVVSGPAYYASVLSYRDAAALVRSLVEAHPINGLASALDEESGLELGGLWVKDSSERIEEDRWIHTLALTVGLVRPV